MLNPWFIFNEVLRMDGMTQLRGYRTHLAVAVSVLTALATMAGMLPTASGQSLSVALAALALSFSRFAQSDLAKKIDGVLAAVQPEPVVWPKAHESVEAGDWRLETGGQKSEIRGQRSFVQPPASSLQPDPLLEAGSDGPRTIKFPSGTTLGLLLAILCLSGRADAQERPLTLTLSPQSRGEGTERLPVATSMQLSPATRQWFYNQDGSCVQCSIGMCGVHTNDRNAASLLWDSDYGPAVRGGSWPSRVEAYCDQRGIKAWSVSGASVDETLPWMAWACRTGRFAAIGAGRAHFQTLYGYEPQHERPWLVCNNQTPQRIDRYSESEFRRLHAASGPWVVILEKPSSDPPTAVKWWK